MSTPIDLSKIYELRKSFTIIGLTGRTGAGCSDVAKLLEDGFNQEYYKKPTSTPKNNTDRKYKIVYNYAKDNFNGYYLIEYKHVLSLFIFNLEIEEIQDYITRFIKQNKNFYDKLKTCFNQIHPELSEISLLEPNNIDDDEIIKLYTIFKSDKFRKCSNNLHESLNKVSPVIRIKILQELSNNIRNGGCATCGDSNGMVTVYNIVTVINKLIKGHKRENNICKVVIDSLRNPLEIMYLKERYSAFYMMAVNRNEIDLDAKLYGKLNNKKLFKEIKEIDKIEYKGGSDTEFYKQNVSECIQKADIHISYLSENQAKDFNKGNITNGNNTSPKFSVYSQILKFVSLIEQPGIITPSPEERSMQIAYTAKYNSGCISRQVGAVITDENYSIKAVGWNNTPEGQTPCLLRNANDLIEGKDQTAFSDYEKTNKEFNQLFTKKYKKINNKNLKGRNVSFCFKCIQNSIKEGKNQVHTRSLHAEESAFLQITKYGGQGIKGGKLFTTASPCELCSKKAYQLGISVIYYIDPYPGIATDHILYSGNKPKELRLFHGAIGSAYHKLYSPFMAYKDELSLLTGVEIKDYASKIKAELDQYKRKYGEIKTKENK